MKCEYRQWCIDRMMANQDSLSDMGGCGIVLLVGLVKTRGIYMILRVETDIGEFIEWRE